MKNIKKCLILFFIKWRLKGKKCEIGKWKMTKPNENPSNIRHLILKSEFSSIAISPRPPVKPKLRTQHSSMGDMTSKQTNRNIHIRFFISLLFFILFQMYPRLVSWETLRGGRENKGPIYIILLGEKLKYVYQ